MFPQQFSTLYSPYPQKNNVCNLHKNKIMHLSNNFFRLILICNSKAMDFHRIFVYGTLKRAQPNYKQLGPAYGIAKYIGQARTVNQWPIVISSRCNIPFLLDREGMGNVGFLSQGNNKKVCGFWSPRMSPYTCTSPFLFIFVAMKRCSIAARIAGSIGILPCCVLNDFFT